jgi:ParB-like nuclease domain
VTKPRAKSKSKKPKGRRASARANEAAPTSWRATLPIHPAAELFPLMSPSELKELAEDIKANGLTSPIALWRAAPDAQLQLLDGRNRLDAIELVGEPVRVDPPDIRSALCFNDDPVRLAEEDPRQMARGNVTAVILDSSVDPYAYVISANARRRHLTAEQKRELIAKVLKAQPEKSDRQIGETAKASHHTVADVSSELEGRGQIAHVEKRSDKKGRKQPAKKAKRGRAPDASPKESEEVLPARAAMRLRELRGREPKPHAEPDADEAERLRKRNEKLEDEKDRLEKENIGLKSEIEEMKDGGVMRGIHRQYVAHLSALAEADCFDALEGLCADVGHIHHGFTLSVEWKGQAEEPKTWAIN